MTVKFYRCAICGKIVAMVKETAVPTICCGQEMAQLIPGTTDGDAEKHVPVVTRNGNIVEVKVGSVEHPMTPEHHVAFIYVECENGGIMVNLTDKSEAIVCTCKDDPVAVYEYCNLHGLWRAEL